MKKRIMYLCLFFWLILASFYTLLQWKELNQFQNQAGLRFETGGMTLQQIEDYENKEENQEMEITAWSKVNQQDIQWKDMGISTWGAVVKVYGNMARVLPFPMKYGGFTFNKDTSGCIISSGLAFAMFQTDDVVGNVVSYKEEKWSIRGVADTKEPILAVFQQDEMEEMPYVELYAREGDSPAVHVEEIKSSLGLFQESYFFAGSFYCSLVRICLSLPFWCLFGYFCFQFRKWNVGKILRIAGKIGLILIFGIGVWYSIRFTADFVPPRWSDFHFFSQKWQEVMEDIIQRRQMPEIYWEHQVLSLTKKTAAGVLAVLTGFAGIGVLGYYDAGSLHKKMRIPKKISLEKRKKLWYSFKRQ